MTESGAPAIALKGVTKRFPGVVANDAITLDFHSGEVHVLLGENGAGKSTLIGHLGRHAAAGRGRMELFGEPARDRLARATPSIAASAPCSSMSSWCRASR